MELCFALPTHISPVRRWDKLLLKRLELSSWWQRGEAVWSRRSRQDQARTNRLELCFALPTHISPVRRWDKLLLKDLNLAVGGREAKQLVPDEVDEDQTGTNRFELCFVLPIHISPVRRWDKLLLRKLNPRQTAALDHYKSHPQIFVAICNFEDYKSFLLLPTAEIGVVFFFCFVLQHIPFGFQSSATSTPSSFQMWSSAFLLNNHNVGQGSVWSLSWRELSICFSTL